MNIDIFLSRETTGFVYGLFASDEPLQIRYVGQTKYAPSFRLRQHFIPTNQIHHNLKPWFTEVKERGAEIGMRIFGEYPKEFLTVAEYRWISFWSACCYLFNRKHYKFSSKKGHDAALKLWEKARNDPRIKKLGCTTVKHFRIGPNALSEKS